MTAPTPSQFEFCNRSDTPTVHLVEIVAPERRGSGYTVKHLHCPFPELPPIVGFAKTVTFKAKDAVPLGQAGYMQKRLDYLDYVAAAPQPCIMVMEDLDGEHAGYGAFWGEVQSNVHKALGALGVVTSGSIRDIPMIAPGFQMLAGSIVPSHAYVHVVDYGVDVNVRGGGQERRPDPCRPPRRHRGAGRQDRRHEGGARPPGSARGQDHRRRQGRAAAPRRSRRR